MNIYPGTQVRFTKERIKRAYREGDANYLSKLVITHQHAILTVNAKMKGVITVNGIEGTWNPKSFVTINQLPEDLFEL